jgi:hypothetical protein
MHHVFILIAGRSTRVRRVGNAPEAPAERWQVSFGKRARGSLVCRLELVHIRHVYESSFGPTGATGPTGAPGPTGATGPSSALLPLHTVEGVGGAGSSALATESPQESLSAATLEAYERDFRAFATWCRARDLTSMPAGPEATMAYLAELLKSGRKPRGVTRVATSVNHACRQAGHPPPCPSSAALTKELERRVPEAFVVESHAESRSSQGEREAFVEWLDWLGTQMPKARRFFQTLAALVDRGQHLLAPDETIGERFTDRGDGAESATTCDLCGHALVRGRYATDAECLAHRCP